MGGYGSGRSGTRLTVENCLSVDANIYARHNMFRPGKWLRRFRWTRGDNEVGSCGILTEISEGWTVCTFQYNNLERPVALSCYTPGFGGRRYFFVCPICHKRMRTLHFRGGEIACRICHNLTYTSCNESHKFDSLFMRMARKDSRYSWEAYRRAFNRQIRLNKSR